MCPEKIIVVGGENEYKIRDIRKRHIGGETQQSIAQDYYISVTTVHNIVHRKTWACIDDCEPKDKQQV